MAAVRPVHGAVGTVRFRRLLSWRRSCSSTGWSTYQLHGRLVANDRLLSAAVAIGTAALAIPLVLMMVFLVQKGWGLLSVHLFYKDLKGVGP